MNNSPVHSRHELMQALDYDPGTGIFRWKVRPSNSIQPGSIAGGVNNEGYHRIGYKGRLYLSHRLAWLFMTGEWPTLIDHRDLNRLNNAFCNLRQATFSENNVNKKPAGRWGKGVTFVPRSGKFRAQIRFAGRRYELGYFTSQQDACAAYDTAARRLHGEFARSS